MHRFPLALAAVLLLAVSGLAQTIRLANYSPAPFSGWKRTTIDVAAPSASGQSEDGTWYVIGRRLGADALRVVDVRIDLAAGEDRTIDLSTFENDVAFTLPPLPSNPLEHFGGPVAVNGVPLAFVSLEPDGAAYVSHLHGRLGLMFHVDLWVTWYPDQPAVAAAEVVVCCSNPTVPDMNEKLAQPLRLTFGDALIVPAGKPPGSPIVAGGTTFWDGQARAVPLHCVWLRHVTKAADWATIGATTTYGIGAVGITKLWPDGNPIYPDGFDPRAWARATWKETIDALHTWDASWGASPNSAITGAQEDQVFVRGEPMLAGGAGAEHIAYFAALTHAKRPCHHLELDGTQVDPIRRPNVVIWSGRPHPMTAVSPDQLGKTGEVNAENSSGGWYGPDHEHLLYNTVTAGARYTGSHACQWILSMQGRLFLMSDTLPSMRPNWSTNRSWAARAIGWRGDNCVHLHDNLQDRALAARVADRWRARWQEVYLPDFGGAPGAIWDVRWNDPRIGNGPWWMPWQQSIGSYGLWLAGRTFGVPEAVDVAIAAAEACVEHDWIRVENRWRSTAGAPWTHAGKLPTEPYEPVPASFWTGTPYNGNTWDWSLVPRWFETTWNVPAIYVAHRERPGNEKAADLWRQVWNDTASSTHYNARCWFPPGSETLPR